MTGAGLAQFRGLTIEGVAVRVRNWDFADIKEYPSDVRLTDGDMRITAALRDASSYVHDASA